MESFEQLAQQYSPMIHKIIRSLNIYKNKDEFFQLGLIGLWEANNRFDPEKGNFMNYAYTFIKGKIMSEMSKTNKQEERTVYPKEEFWELIEDSISDCPLEKDLLLSYCTNMTENQTKWVLYTCLTGLSVKEIAAKENVSVSAVKQWKQGAKGKLRKIEIG